MSLATYADKFSRLNVGRVGDHERPHKPVMLLALLDLFEQGVIKENRITYSPDLLELFGEYFDAVRSERDQPTPINPFFYLRRDGFWHHHPALVRTLYSTSARTSAIHALARLSARNTTLKLVCHSRGRNSLTTTVCFAFPAKSARR
jgi:predicted restriction endonuclease